MRVQDPHHPPSWAARGGSRPRSGPSRRRRSPRRRSLWRRRRWGRWGRREQPRPRRRRLDHPRDDLALGPLVRPRLLLTFREPAAHPGPSSAPRVQTSPKGATLEQIFGSSCIPRRARSHTLSLSLSLARARPCLPLWPPSREAALRPLRLSFSSSVSLPSPARVFVFVSCLV